MYYSGVSRLGGVEQFSLKKFFRTKVYFRTKYKNLRESGLKPVGQMA